MRELSLFTGIGGGLLASKLLDWQTVCGVEINPYCRKVLLARQADGILDKFPIWDDIKTFDGKAWQGQVDVVSGGFPCQDISSAGKQAGLSGERSGLWFEMLRVIGEVRPPYIFAENSPNLRTKGLQQVLEGLAGLGYDAQWGVLGGWHLGAPHKRNRMWIVASHPYYCRQRGLPFHAETSRTSQFAEVSADNVQYSHPNSQGLEVCQSQSENTGPRRETNERSMPFTWCNWWRIPDFTGVDEGMANRVDRTVATGNGQISAVAAAAWEILSP